MVDIIVGVINIILVIVGIVVCRDYVKEAKKKISEL